MIWFKSTRFGQFAGKCGVVGSLLKGVEVSLSLPQVSVYFLAVTQIIGDNAIHLLQSQDGKTFGGNGFWG